MRFQWGSRGWHHGIMQGMVALKLLLLVLCTCSVSAPVVANTPPKFVGGGATEIVLRVKEGPESLGKLLYRLRGEDADGDPLTFGVLGPVGPDLLKIESTSTTEANVYLKKELDREIQDSYSLVITLTDGKLGQGSYITQSMLLIVEDINDNKPVFHPFRSSISLREDAEPGVIETVEATDLDEGPFGQVIYQLQETDSDTLETFSIQTYEGKGVISLIGSLDYERKSLYQLRVLAVDRAISGRRNTATAAILIQVEDVEDQPPVFTFVPSVTRIPEDLPLNSPVLAVTAVDGDRGVNNAVTYRISKGGRGLFAIDKNTGIVSVQAKLDRESPDNRNGAFILEIEAQEVTVAVFPPPSVTTEVTIILTDVNDETPTFRSREYTAEVNENAQVDSPLKFLGNSIPKVYDYDQGNNGTFEMYLEGDRGIFEVTPSGGVNEASFLIRVKNPSPLDYEKIKVMNFKIVAKETVPTAPKSSTADVRVYIRDTNDNFPHFSEDSYRVTIPEDAPEGTTVAVIKAEDPDSGDYGTAGIRYTEIRGQIANKLNLDSITGVITVKTSNHGFDREVTSQYHLTVEARDNNGLGNRNTVQLEITLEDVNDNAPRFLQPKYEARINENESDFLTPLVLQAQDADLKGSKNSEIRYQIIAGDPQNNFTIDALTGEIRPRTPIDFERVTQGKGDIRTFTLNVRASDLGKPPKHSDVSVIIYVQDMNDHSPVFQRSTYSKAIPEDTREGTVILQVQAIDGDHSSAFNRVVYRIQSGAQDKFVIDANTGVISVASGANLDPDRSRPKKLFYILQVVALDGGFGEQQRQSSAVVNISIIDVNNKAPVFVTPGMVFVREDAPYGFFVTRVTATDVDERPLLRYTIDYDRSEAKNEDGVLVSPSDYDYNDIFDIISVDGTIKVAKPLDREKVETIKLLLRVEDLAAATDDQTATATLTVKIEDVNDNRPVFRKPYYKQYITENAKAGAPIVTVTADDADQNKTVIYSIEGRPELTELVNIDSKTGEIVVNHKIDREIFSWINLTVRATDRGVPPLSGVADLYIQVLDENDNNPVFLEGPTEFFVPEDVSIGEEVALVEATDADVGQYGKVTYLMDATSAQGKFRIDRETGAIIVSDYLDREETNQYKLIIQAWDNYEYGFPTGESRKAFKQIIIRVTDVNDEAPMFVRTDHCASITEFHHIRETVMTVSAIDGDDPNTPNGRVVFSIEGGNDDGFFDIENLAPNSARVLTRFSLRGKVGNYSIRIRARDQGVPALETTESFDICVTDVNDHSPVFLTPPRNHTVRIPENATLGSVVVEVRAVDADSGPNGEVRYQLRKLPNEHWKTFQINERTGFITLANFLDREKQRVYELRVEAYDLGQPTSLSSDLDLTVIVTNVNDYAPEFTEDLFQVTFTENLPSGQEFFKLLPTVDKDDDDDSNIKSIPCYYIVGGNEKGRFRLDIFTHQLYTTEPLDREEQANYTLIVRATDDCFHEPPPVDQFDPKDNALLQVVVTVRDVNDNAPKFVKPVFTGGISTEADFGSVFMSVKAVDDDEGINSVVHYYITGEIRQTLSEGLETVQGPPFIINRKTGEISLNFDPQKGMKGYFDFEVKANDTDGLADTARVFIYLLREDQRVRFVLRLTPEELREKLEKFREVLGNITGAIVNVDGYKFHENRDGSVDKKKTDLHLHFVNKHDNSIMEVNTVLTLIDKNIEFLDELYKEFNVLHSEPAEMAQTGWDSDDQIRAWLIGLVVFLSIMLILVISLCLTQRSRYERQLKAATATAFGSHDSTLNRVDVVPNTNQHSVEGSNPIWMHAYDNEWYKEEDELSHRSVVDNNSLDDNAVEEPETPPDSLDGGSPTRQTLCSSRGGMTIVPAERTAVCNGSSCLTPQNITVSEPPSASEKSHSESSTEQNNRQNDLNRTNNRTNIYISSGGGPHKQIPLEISKLETSEL